MYSILNTWCLGGNDDKMQSDWLHPILDARTRLDCSMYQTLPLRPPQYHRSWKVLASETRCSPSLSIMWPHLGAPSVYRYQANWSFITNGRGFRSRWMSCDTSPRLGEVWLQWLVRYGWGQAIHNPSTTLGGARMFGQGTIVGSKCLFCYTGSRPEVGRKKEETRVSKIFQMH